MERRLDALESRVAEISARLEAIERRLDAVAVSSEEAPAATTLPAGAAEEIARATEELPPIASLVALLGRTFVVFAGAFLLRTAADAGAIPVAVGFALGLAYAGGLLFLTDRDAAAGKPLSACFHAISAVIIALPLVYEGAVRFGVLGPSLAAVVLLLVAAGPLLVAWRRRLPALVWLASAGASGLGLVLALRTGALVHQGAALVAIGGLTVWIGYERGWLGPRWLVAGAADLVVMQTALLASRAGSLHAPYEALSRSGAQLLAVGLPLVYLGCFAFHNLARRRNVTPFEVAQTVAALAIGLGGALRIGSAAAGDHAVLGVATVVVAVGCYLVAFAFAERRLGMGRSFHFYSLLALVLTVTGSATLLQGEGLALVWSALALGAAVLGGQLDRVTLRIHAFVYAAAAALQSGLVRAVIDAFVGGVEVPWKPLSGAPTSVLTALLVCYAVLVITARRRDFVWRARLPRLAIAVLVVAGCGAIPIEAVARGPWGSASPAVVALTRSLVLSLSAPLLAAVGRRRVVRELTWLVYPLLAIGGAKLLLDDLAVGTAVTLFIAFAVYGAALIVAPRLARGGRDREGAETKSGPA